MRKYSTREAGAPSGSKDRQRQDKLHSLPSAESFPHLTESLREFFGFKAPETLGQEPQTDPSSAQRVKLVRILFQLPREKKQEKERKGGKRKKRKRKRERAEHRVCRERGDLSSWLWFSLALGSRPPWLLCTHRTCLAPRLLAASRRLPPDWAEAPQSAARLGRWDRIC